MADNVTKNISIALYRYLCQNIVGTEDHVKQLRWINTVRDNLSSDEKITFITSGSFGEGLEMRGSDFDLMFVNKRRQVHTVKSSSLPYLGYLTMDTDDVNPGFTLLRVNNTFGLSPNLVQLNGKYYLSSALFRQEQVIIDKTLIIHGPCISDQNGLIDVASCLHCKTWVSPATKWTTRPSNQWPSHNVKQPHSLRAQSIPLTSTCSNKYQYKQYRSCLSALHHNIYHDAISGWLMLASFFYKTKQYNNALRIIMYSISKCTPEKMYRSMDLLDIHYRLLKLKTIQKKSIAQQRKIMFIDDMRFDEYSVLIPNELLMLVKNQMCTIESVPYAYFLKFLCHYHLKNGRQIEDSLRDLRLCIAEKYSIKSRHAKFSAYNLLEVAFQLISDTESAQRAFLQPLVDELLYAQQQIRNQHKLVK
ncbi:unnamed protein product [Mytilus coruscus]|uniref:Mab-21-like HhH/H2TH-like domain-containing protein n=1 Tax=Mytilus coruscus TaxID=42192 RepID=A0A6J8EVT5_MYTCO|nr:unnamed protein product [Mytilus coruscus]